MGQALSALLQKAMLSLLVLVLMMLGYVKSSLTTCVELMWMMTLALGGPRTRGGVYTIAHRPHPSSVQWEGK